MCKIMAFRKQCLFNNNLIMIHFYITSNVLKSLTENDKFLKICQNKIHNNKLLCLVAINYKSTQ